MVVERLSTASAKAFARSASQSTAKLMAGRDFFMTMGVDVNIVGTLGQQMVDQGFISLWAHVVDVGLDLDVSGGVSGGVPATNRRLHTLAQDQAQHIGNLEIPRAQAVADALWPESARRLEAVHRSLENGGARGGGGLPFHPAVGAGNALEDFLGGRGRHRQPSVGAIDEAAAELDNAAKHLLHLQMLQADGRAHHIDDGVHGTHFMEMDSLDGNVMNLGLGDRNLRKDGLGAGDYAGHQVGGVQKVQDVRVMPVAGRRHLVPPPCLPPPPSKSRTRARSPEMPIFLARLNSSANSSAQGSRCRPSRSTASGTPKSTIAARCMSPPMPALH